MWGLYRPLPDEVPITDGDTNPPDPGTGWGYCRHCRRQEPVDDQGLLVPHDISATHNKAPCPGGGEVPTPQPAPDVEATPCICGLCQPDTRHKESYQGGYDTEHDPDDCD